MPLNHTIVWCADRQRSSTFLTELRGRPPAAPFGPFMMVELDNGVSLDLHQTDDAIQSRPGEINHNDGGRGVYFTDPDGHLLEVITRPYGSS